MTGFAVLGMIAFRLYVWIACSPRPRDSGPLMSAVISEPQAPSRFRVRVWFGEHVIAQYVAEQALADRYATAMKRRFAGLLVTNELVSPK